jgi:hypothetical protein
MASNIWQHCCSDSLGWECFPSFYLSLRWENTFHNRPIFRNPYLPSGRPIQIYSNYMYVKVHIFKSSMQKKSKKPINYLIFISLVSLISVVCTRENGSSRTKVENIKLVCNEYSCNCKLTKTWESKSQRKYSTLS